jgi:hypothetical protein
MMRAHVFLIISNMWKEVAAKRNNDPILGSPPKDITIFEAARADFARAKCVGPYTALETRPRQGASKPPLETEPEKLLISYQGAFWEHAVARFCVDEEAKLAALELIYGPRNGRGFHYTVDEAGKIKAKQVWFI